MDDVNLPWFALLAAFAVAEIFTFDLRFRGEAHTFSISEIVVVVGLFMLSPVGLIAAELLAVVPVMIILRRATVLKVCFNAALYALGTEIALVIRLQLSDEVGGLVDRLPEGV